MKDFSQRYLRFLKEELKGLNLTRITDDEEFYNKQILDSVIPLKESKVFQNEVKEKGLLVDVGFGGGFPLIPLAYASPETRFLGFEARAKKVLAVDQIAKHLDLHNVTVFHNRLENIIFDLPAVITFKAVGKVEEFVSKICHTQPLTVFFYKGPQFYELESIDSVLKNWSIVEELYYDLPETEGRFLFGLKSKAVPRGTIVSKKPNKDLVKVSDLL